MRKGMLIRNCSASDRNPQRYFIYTGISGKYANGLTFDSKGQLEKIYFNKYDFLQEGFFEPVGYSKGFDILKEDLKKLYVSSEEVEK